MPRDLDAWKLAMDLVVLVQLICAAHLTLDMIEMLQPLTEKWLKDFRRLFPDFRLTPKFHFILHYKHLIGKIGPLRRAWTMRFEAKHEEFKTMAVRAHNRKNVCKTLAVRHQEKMTVETGDDVL